MKHKFWRIRSFATRLSIWVILTAAIILLTTALVVNFFVRDGILREEQLRATSALENAEEHINKVFIAVETAVKNHTNEIKKNVNAPHEEMYRITREMLENGVPEDLWDQVIAEAQQFSANVCQSINNSVDMTFADKKKKELINLEYDE